MGFLFGGKSQNTTEDRLDRLHIQDVGYGNPIPICYGSRRVSPLLIYYTDFKAIEHKQSQGGKGGSGSTSTTYTYSATVVLSCCEGPIVSFGKMWRDKESYPNLWLGFTGFAGSYSQVEWSYLTSAHPSEALSYRGTAYIAKANYDLGSGGRLGSHSLEIFGVGYGEDGQAATDAHLSTIIIDFLTNAHYGAGFPVAKIGDMTLFNQYCKANNLLISPLIAEQRAAVEWLAEFALIANTAIVWSEGVLKFIPLSLVPAASAYATYTPVTTIAANFTDNDYKDNEDGKPVRCTRKRQSDCFNSVTIEHLKRDNAYNTFSTTVNDQANIENFGLRKKDNVTLHSICTEAAAQFVANNILEREVYRRNSYQFTIDWTFDYLEPADLVTLTESGLGLSQAVCRITDISDSDGELQMTVESVNDANVTVTYSSDQGYTPVNHAVEIGDVN